MDPQPTAQQSIREVFAHQKDDLFLYLTEKAGAEGTVLVFCRQRDQVHHLTSLLNRSGAQVESVHGTTKPDLRAIAFEKLVTGDLPLVVATEAVAREVDLTGVATVIYFDFYEVAADYERMVATASREVITLVTQNDHKALAKLEERIGTPLPRFEEDGFSYDAQPKFMRPPRVKGHKPNKTDSKPLQHKKPKLKNKGPRRKTGRTRTRRT